MAVSELPDFRKGLQRNSRRTYLISTGLSESTPASSSCEKMRKAYDTNKPETAIHVTVSKLLTCPKGALGTDRLKRYLPVALRKANRWPLYYQKALQ